jgi:hypothetical protein
MVHIKRHSCHQLWRFNGICVDHLAVLLCILKVEHHLLTFIQFLYITCVHTSKSLTHSIFILIINPSIDHIGVRNIDISSRLFKIHASNISIRSI